ncbi:MAG: T9SS type A sorting domain-containing protein [Flavobacteriales bacterium]
MMKFRHIITLMLVLLVGVSQAQQVTSGEWFWDTDPGTGNATPISATDGNFDEAIEELMESSSTIPVNGTHTFNLRVQDDNGTWSPLFTTVVETWEALSALQDAEVVMAEFFWDADPGAGNGTPMVALDGNFDEAVEAITASSSTIPASIGPHVLYVRAKEDEGNWGPTFATVVDVWANLSTARTSFVKSAEYYFDNDPGAGNGTTILAQDGNFNQTLEAIIGGDIPAPVSIGVHTLYIRPMDEEDEWGPSFGIVVNMDTALGAPPFNTMMVGEDDICQPDLAGTFTYTATQHTGTAFEWEVNGGTITSGAGTEEVEVSWDGSAPYSIKVLECDVTEVCDSVEFSINVLQPVTHSISLEICDGDSVLIDGNWEHGAGPYTEVYTAGNTCDSTVTYNLTVNPTYDLTESASVCDGESYTFPDGSMQTISSQVVYTSNLTTVATNCDSVITTTVSVNPTYNQSITVEICDGDSVYLEGQWQFTADTYTDNLQTVGAGCDSVVHTTVVVNDTYDLTESASVCDGESFTFPDGSIQTITSQVVYTSNLTTVATNCDSIITTTVSVNPTYNQSVTVEICDGDSVYLEGQWQFTADTYTDNLQTVGAGCDSVVNTTVVLNDTYFTQVDLTVQPGGSAYLEGEWQTVAGLYYDTLNTTITMCDSVIETNFQISPVGIDEHELNVRVYPNPSVSGQTITAEFAEVLPLVDLEVLDMAGRIVYSEGMQNQQMVRFNLNLATGVYRLKLVSDEKEFGEKLIIR